MKISLAAAALSGSLFATSAFAKENRAHHQRDLVGLGDSITFGYNLGANNNQPSQYAFPFLMGEDTHLHVRDLGIPGWTTSDLLNAIKHNEQFRDAIKQANFITLDIGSNDLLHTLSTSNGDIPLPVRVQAMLPILTNNLNQVIEEISRLSPAKIVVYNIYNPFQVQDPMHLASNQLLTQIINPAISGVVSQHKGVKLADAFGAFGENQALYVRTNDVHPTILGQEVLAKAGEAALGLNKHSDWDD